MITSTITRELWFDQGKGLLWNGTEFLLPVFYGIINDTLPSINAFSLGLSFANGVALTLVIHALVRFSVEVKNKERMLLVAVLSLLLIIPQLLTINSTRVAVVGTYGALLAMLLPISRTGYSMSVKSFGLISFLAILALIRMEAVTLVGAVVGVPLFFFAKRDLKFLTPLALGILALLTYNIALSEWGPKEMKAFYYYENELIDRGNVCVQDAYSRGLIGSEVEELDETDTLSLGATALFYFSVFDDYTVNPEFMSSLTCSDEESSVYSWLLGGVSLEGWMNSLQLSIEDSRRGWWVPALSCCSFLFMLLSRGLSKETFYAGFTLVLPFILAMHITVPARFLVPFLSVYSALCVLGATLSRPQIVKYTVWVGLLIVGIAVIEEYHWLSKRKRLQANVENNLSGLKALTETENKFILLQTALPHVFMPPQLSYVPNQTDSVLFMDEYFTYKPFFEDWKAHCACRPRSVVDRLEFASHQEAIYISTDNGVKFISDYSSLVHDKHFQFAERGAFNKEFNMYQVIREEL